MEGQEIAAMEELNDEAKETKEESGSGGIGICEEDQDEQYYPQATEDTLWVTAATQYGWSSRLPEQYWQELNATSITGLAPMNYCSLLFEEEEDDDDDD